ncbi:MAG TPA: type II CAAX endopeptidase family protein [Bryobacteraceae bacterium]|nr:type II CAAX endopeptidase family protein [Bryobacteraceae bacterium]
MTSGKTPAAEAFQSAGGETPLSARDRFAASLRGFGPIGILAILVILLTGNISIGRMVAVPLGAILVLAWTWASCTPWRDIGYVRPKSWLATAAVSLALGCAFKVLMKVLVMPILGADPVNRTYHFLTGNRALLPAAVWAMLVAGFSEETVFRGYLFERGFKLFGKGAVAKAAIVLVTSAAFGLAHHSDQGLAGSEQGAIVGLVFGTIFATTGRLFPLMFAHAAFDLTALAIIYWNLESSLAHWIFK